MSTPDHPSVDPLDDDPSIPLLTDVIRLPADPFAPQPAASGPISDEAVLAERIRLQVLARLRSPEAALEEEMMEHLTPMLERATKRFAAELASQVRATLAYITESVVERAVEQAIAAEREGASRAADAPQPGDAPNPGNPQG